MSDQRTLQVPRGSASDLTPLVLNMTVIYQAEARLHEVRTVTPVTQKDLEGLFNESANMTTKYLAWIEYEILQATKAYSLDRATVILDKAPDEFRKVKDTGIKFNEDFREALIARDAACQTSLDVLNALKAVKALLEAHAASFVRAHYSARNAAQSKDSVPAPTHSGNIGQTFAVPQDNFMGQRKL